MNYCPIKKVSVTDELQIVRLMAQITRVPKDEHLRALALNTDRRPLIRDYVLCGGHKITYKWLTKRIIGPSGKYRHTYRPT